MAKRELIDRIHLLAEIKKLQKSPWYNLGKDNMVVLRSLYNERKEAVEVVRDLCVNDESAITEQEIVKPYLEKLKEQIVGKSFTEEIFDEVAFNSMYPESVSKDTAECENYIEMTIIKMDDVLQMIDNLLSEQEGK